MKVLVAGATGVLGGEIAQRLKAKGCAVRAIKRPTSAAQNIAALEAAGIELVQADLKDRRSLDRACADMDAVISTATAILSTRPDDTLQSVDLTGQKTSLMPRARAALRTLCILRFLSGVIFRRRGVRGTIAGKSGCAQQNTQARRARCDIATRGGEAL
jgi:prephenate dehydrogenase